MQGQVVTLEERAKGVVEELRYVSPEAHDDWLLQKMLDHFHAVIRAEKDRILKELTNIK